jgi:hypothetical protein
MEHMADDHQGTLTEDIFESRLQGFMFERILLEGKDPLTGWTGP